MRDRLRLGRWACTLLILGFKLTHPTSAEEVGPPPDCATSALFVLLQTEGRPASLERVRTELGGRHKDGYSLSELAGAAGRLGLPLRGVRFGEGDSPLDRSAIVFIQEAQGGHFAVLRPVGTTGTMVQVIDPPMPPQIVDYDRLFRDSPWTGKILVPAPPWYERVGLVLVGATGLGLILIPIAVRMRRSRGVA